jgi:uncharacterized protein
LITKITAYLNTQSIGERQGIRYRIKLFSFFLFSLFSVAILRGQPTVPPKPRTLVNDYAGLLSASDVQSLERTLVAYNDSTSTQITIVTIQNLGDYDIVDWAVEIGKKWGVGRADKNNGVVILVGIEPKRRVFIATGPGVQGFLPDVICKRIIDQKIVPRFREQKYYEGFNDAFQSIRAAAKGEFVNEERRTSDGNDSDAGFWFFIIVLILIILLIMFINNRRRYAHYDSRRRHYGDSGGWIFWGGGFPSGGGGGWGDSDSGGFGGFGGGDFDGGGAGGDW